MVSAAVAQLKRGAGVGARRPQEKLEEELVEQEQMDKLQEEQEVKPGENGQEAQKQRRRKRSNSRRSAIAIDWSQAKPRSDSLMLPK